MDKIKYLLVLFLALLIIFKGEAQSNNAIIQRGLFRTQLTISPSLMFAEPQSYFYLHGNLEGYLSSDLSLSGEAYYFLGNITSQVNPFKYNHSTFFGANWHLTNKNNDLYFGLQPGLSLTSLAENENRSGGFQTGVNPLFSTVIGYNFYLNRVFHFFLQTRLILGTHNYDIPKNLSGCRFSAGLGFNIIN